MPAKYERLADAIRQQIKTGELKPGDKLPSIRELKEIYNVSYGPVRAAMLVLKAEGLVEGEPGVAVYVKRP